MSSLETLSKRQILAKVSLLRLSDFLVSFTAVLVAFNLYCYSCCATANILLFTLPLS